MLGLVQAMQTQAHTQAALQAQLEAQEGEMQQYLEEKKASQKRPTAMFQWQDKKKAVYQAPQCPITTNSAQEERKPQLELVESWTLHALIQQFGASSGDLQQVEASLDIGGGFPYHGLEATTPQNPEQSSFGGFLGLPKESFNGTFDPFGDLLRGNK
ncbi:hypothetical protein Taro_016700 [Colocasia esculenta]|uniref:Uncharacterized protein n=1 Tax=Colocasia esculenta TaxID=4460 RepID=A0A843UL27_COLES|nr:hypothetical protein [Colocasia esculenta]